MTVLLGICAVISTLGLVAMAIAIIRAMRRFEHASDQVTRTAEVVRASMGQIERLASEFEAVLPPLKRAAADLENLGDRAMKLSNAVLDELEKPLHTTMALLSGVRAGTRSLMGAFLRRAGRSPSNGGQPNERASAGPWSR
jgi:ABC-type transporter Mla subunit MlaD